jgi:serine/threonine protein kinase
MPSNIWIGWALDIAISKTKMSLSTRISRFVFDQSCLQAVTLMISPQIKLIDFGSATIDNPDDPLPYYDIFYGTTAYAASEILRMKPYQAPPAEIWTLGILLSYLLTGSSPFANEYDAILGNIKPELVFPSKEAEHLLRRCLNPHPKLRATIAEVKAHPWLEGAFDGP